MVLPATVGGSRADQEVDAVPHEGEGGGVDQEGGSQAAEVVEVLHRVHGEAGEGLNVSVAVVEKVDVLVQGLDVNEPELR